MQQYRDTMSEEHSRSMELNVRNRDVFQRLVEMYLENGSPVGSRSLSRKLGAQLSSATIRNAMQDLECLGLLKSPHVSAGRIPTEFGLRLFVDEYLEVSKVDDDERSLLDAIAVDERVEVAEQLDRAGTLLSKLTHSASLVLAPKCEMPIKHVEFVSLAPDRALVVLVTSDGHVENRMFKPPDGQTPSSMREAANFVNSISAGRSISELKAVIDDEIDLKKAEIDKIVSQLVKDGLAVWEKSVGKSHGDRLIVRGRSNLLDGDENSIDMGLIRELFDDLERKRDIADFLQFVEDSEGVRIFIGSENKLFSLTGSTLVISPYMSNDRKLVGAVGVIGPTRLNYGRVVSIVDYTAQLVGRVVEDRQ